MANPYYNNDTNTIINGTIADAADVENKLDDVSAAFDSINVVVNKTLSLDNPDMINRTISDAAIVRANKVLGFDATGELILKSDNGSYRGDWVSGTFYTEGDIVKDTTGDFGSGVDAILVCTLSHTSSNLATDTQWTTLIDVSVLEQAVIDAEAAASAAAASELSASTSESNAALSETNASNAEVSATASALSAGSSETNAAASALAAGLSEASVSADAVAAGLSKDFANAWATEAEDVLVDDGVNPTDFSAYHYAQKSQIVEVSVLAAIDSVVNSNSVVDVLIYDTSSDDDGGAWVDKTSSRSWYNETLNTSTRGGTKDFPKLAIITLEANTLRIFDGTDSEVPMWLIHTGFYASSAISLAAKNGIIYITTNANTVNHELNFREDSIFTRYSSSGANGFSPQNISDRQSMVNGAGDTDTILYWEGTDVEVASDGDMGNIVYYATTSGLSRVGADGSVSNWTDDGNTINITGALTLVEGYIVFNADNSLDLKYTSRQLTNSELVESRYNSSSYNFLSFNQGITWSVDTIPSYFDGTNELVRSTSGQYTGTSRSLTKFYDTEDTVGGNMVAKITDTFNSGILPGNNVMAVLSSSTSGTLTNSTALPDRSHKDNDFNTVGNINVSSASTGSDLMAFSGFSTSNYFEQAANTDLDVGSGDFYLIAWFKVGSTATSQFIFDRRAAGDIGDVVRMLMTPSGEIQVIISGATVDTITSTNSYNDDNWHQVVWVRGNLFVDGTLVGTSIQGSDVGNPTALSYIGISNINTSAFLGSLSLVRLGLTGLSSNQIKILYEEERPMFNENSLSTLQGSSSDVKAIDYDESTNTITACSTDHITKLSGLVVVENEADVATSISTVGGKEMKGV